MKENFFLFFQQKRILKAIMSLAMVFVTALFISVPFISASPKSQGFILEQAVPESERLTGNLLLKATLYHNGPVLKQGVTWRIFSTSLNGNNKLSLLQKKVGGEASFVLPTGHYFIYASFGRLTIEKRIEIKAKETLKEIFNFKAGGLKLKATLAGGKIDERQARFSIYSDNTENEETSLLLANIAPNEVVRLPVGTYHILSKYGTVNALKRTEIKIQPGKLTEAVVEHSAAKVTLRLVRRAGGEALADTSWVIMDSAGDALWENVGPYATLILEEGPYSIVAKNNDTLYQKNITVVSGKDQHIDISTQEVGNANEADDSMD